MSLLHRLIIGPATLAALLLSACGGGGGGASAPSLSFGPLSPASSRFDIPEGVNTPNLVLSSTVSGDLGGLNGRTLYVIVEDPLGLFQPTASVGFDPATSRASVHLSGATQTVAGDRHGRLSVRLCLDAACQQPLLSSPLAAVMSIRVRAGMRVAPARVDLSLPFGAAPTAELVRVTVPEGRPAGDFRYGLLSPASGTAVDAFDLTAASTPDSGVVVRSRLLHEGRYERQLHIESSTDPGSATHAFYSAIVPLTLTVTPSALDHAFHPASLALEAEFGHPYVIPVRIDSIARDGFFALVGKTYDNSGAPPEAAATGPYNQWLLTGGADWNAFVCSGGDCLPRGVYRATLRFGRYDAGGRATGQEVDVPVSMTVR